MRLRRRSAPETNYDSVLDTMTNVVGILVIVVAVTQLNVRGAVERTRALAFADAPETTYAPVDEEVLEATRRQVAEEEAKRGATTERWEASAPDEEAIRKKLADAEAEQEGILARRRSRDDERRSVQELEHASERLESTLAELRLKITNTEREVQTLKALAEDAEAKGQRKRPDLAIRIPNPSERRAQDKESVDFLVRGGRVYRFAPEKLIARFFEDANDQVPRSVAIRGGNTLREWLASFGNRRGYEDDVIRLRFESQRVALSIESRLTVTCELKPNAPGDDLSGLDLSPSDFQTTVRASRPSRHWIHFVVYDDSFDTYLRARRIVEDAGFAAGWTPYGKDQVVAFALGEGGGGPRPLPD